MDAGAIAECEEHLESLRSDHDIHGCRQLEVWGELRTSETEPVRACTTRHCRHALEFWWQVHKEPLDHLKSVVCVDLPSTRQECRDCLAWPTLIIIPWIGAQLVVHMLEDAIQVRADVEPAEERHAILTRRRLVLAQLVVIDFGWVLDVRTCFAVSWDQAETC